MSYLSNVLSMKCPTHEYFIYEMSEYDISFYEIFPTPKSNRQFLLLIIISILIKILLFTNHTGLFKQLRLKLD